MISKGKDPKPFTFYTLDNKRPVVILDADGNEDY